MTYIRNLFAAIAIIACPLFLSGQVLSDTLPLGKEVIKGKLPNGLRYMVRQNPFPAKKVELQVVVNVGSILEKESQWGMSHFLEHMMFNGSSGYPGDSAMQALKTIGVKYGFDLNAFTDYDKTIYIIPIPTDDPENIVLGLDIIYEWLTSLNLYSADIEKEKKIVIQEIRDAVPHDVFHDTKLAGSRYLNRFVLGSEESINAIDSVALREYYDDWYRPDLITIIAVGDMQRDAMVQLISDRFSGMKTRSLMPPPRAHYSLPVHGKCVWQRQADTLVRKNRVDMIFPVADITSVTYGDARELLKERLFARLLSHRLESPLRVDANYSRNWYLSDIAHKVFEVSADTDEELSRNLVLLGNRLAQIKRYGFGSEEVSDVKRALLEKMNKEDFERSSQSICSDYIDLAVAGEYHISPSEKYRFYSEVLEGITPEELTQLVEVFFNQRQRIVMCYTCNPTRSEVNDEKTFLRAFKKGLKQRTDPYVYTPKLQQEEADDSDVEGFTVETAVDGYVVDEKYYAEIGVTELLLNNGMRVALKPTPMADNSNIMVSLFGKGGFSSLPDGELPYYQGTSAYLDMGGICGMTNEEMNSMAYKNEVSVAINIGDYYQEVFGVAFEGNIEELMKYLYLRMTCPTKDQEGFDEEIREAAAAFGKQEESWLLKQLQQDPFRVLQHKVARLSGALNRNARELNSPDEIQQQNLDAMFNFYSSLFGNPASLTAVVSGKFDIGKVRETVVKYLGALPEKNESPELKFVGEDFPAGVWRDTIFTAEQPRTYVSVLMHGHYQQSLENTIIFKMMRDILQTRIIGSLRENEGLVYSPYVNVTYRAFPNPVYYFDMNYFCDNDKQSYLETLLLQEIDKLRNEEIPRGELDGIKQSFRIAKREQLDVSNLAGWREKLKEIYLECGSLDEFEVYDTILNEITTADIREAFQQFMLPQQYSIITIVDDK